MSTTIVSTIREDKEGKTVSPLGGHGEKPTSEAKRGVRTANVG